MFNNSKYTRWYYNIISSALQRTQHTEYVENHHIRPKALGGVDANENLVMLTAREHYMCHMLLPKMCNNTQHRAKMAYAYFMMTNWDTSSMNGKRYTSRMHQYMRESYIEMLSGPNSPLYGLLWSDERKQSHSDRLKQLGINKGLVRTQEHRAKISATRKQNKTGAGENNPMHGKNHTAESIRKMSEVKRQRIQERGIAAHKAKQIAANPKSRRVQTPDGQIFSSLSEAGRTFGFVGLTAPRRRIKNGEWKYV